MYPQIRYIYPDPVGSPGVLAPSGWATENYKIGGPLPAAAAWSCAGSESVEGVVIDMLNPIIGFWHNAWWEDAGDPSDLLRNYPAFFLTDPGAVPQNDLTGLEPALAGTWDDGSESGSLIAIGYSVWEESLHRFRVGWRTPLGFFEQRPDGAILHPVLGTQVGSGTWYHPA